MTDFLCGRRRAFLSLALVVTSLAACDRNTTPTAPPQADPAARTALAETLYDAKASREERNQCWEKLRLIFGRAAHRKDARAAGAALSEALRSDSSALRRAALLALEGELGREEVLAQADALGELLRTSAKRSGPRPEGPATLKILARIGPELAPLRESIESCLDLDPRGAVHCLILMGEAAEPSRAALEARLLSANSEHRQLCHQALLGLTPPGISPRGLEKILETIRGGEHAGDLTSALHALSELTAIEQKDHEVALKAIIPVLIERISDRSEAVVIASCGALARCPSTPDGLKILSQAVRHQSSAVRKAAARALFALKAWVELSSALSERITQDEVAVLLPLLPQDELIVVYCALNLILERKAEAALRSAFKDLIRVSPSLVSAAVSNRWQTDSFDEAYAGVLLQLPANLIERPIHEALDSNSSRFQMAALQCLLAASQELRPSVSIQRVRELSRSANADVQRLALRALLHLDTSLVQASAVAKQHASAIEAALSGDRKSINLIELRQQIIALSEIKPEALESSAAAILCLGTHELPSEDPYIARLFLQLARSRKLTSAHSRALFESSVKRLSSEDQAASRLQWLQVIGELAAAQADLDSEARTVLKRNARASFAPGRLVAIQQLGRLRALPELLELLPQARSEEREAAWKAIEEATSQSKDAATPAIYQSLGALIHRGLESSEADPAISALGQVTPDELRAELVRTLMSLLGGPNWSAARTALSRLGSSVDLEALAQEALDANAKGDPRFLRVFLISGFSSEARERALSASRALTQSETCSPESLQIALQLLARAAQEGDLELILKMALESASPRDALAAQALWDCERPSVVPHLCRLLEQGPAAQRAATARALGEPRGLSPADPQRLEVLVRAAMRAGDDVSEAAMGALLQLAPQSEEAGEALDFGLRSALPKRIEGALRAMVKSPLPSSPRRGELLRQIGEGYESLRPLTIDALAASRDF